MGYVHWWGGSCIYIFIGFPGGISQGPCSDGKVFASFKRFNSSVVWEVSMSIEETDFVVVWDLGILQDLFLEG